MISMIRVSVLSALAASLAAPALAQAVVRGDWIALRDVAPVAGEAGAILLGPSPPPGEKLALDPAFVIAVAQKSGVALALPLDTPLWVTRASSRIEAPTARTAPAAPAARQAPRASETDPALAGAPLEVLLLTRDVKRGDILLATDVAYGPPPSGRSARGPALAADLAIGKAVRRNLMAGAVLESLDLEAPDLVRKGQAVSILYTAPGMRLSVSGVAQADAGLGEPVRVLNNQSRRSIDAIVTGPGEAALQRR